jgi:hypothetical protein
MDDFLVKFSQFDQINNKTKYQEARQHIFAYGIDNFRDYLMKHDILESDKITTISSKYNVFARFIKHEEVPWYGSGGDHPLFFWAHNLREYDEHMYDPEWISRAAMSTTHKFIISRNLTWTHFNALVLGMDGDYDNAITILEEMRNYAHKMLPNMNLGLFFHIYPSNSIQLIHLHILDMDNLGPSYYKYSYKNVALDDVVQTLKEEKCSNNNASRSVCRAT